MEIQQNIFSKSVEGYFSKSQNSPAPAGAIQKKLFSIDDFEEEKRIAEEQKQKEMEEKKQQKKEHRHEIATKNKELEQIKKAEKDKKDEKEMWARLRELNNNFAKIKEQIKLDKKKKLFFPLGFVYFNTINYKVILIKKHFFM